MQLKHLQLYDIEFSDENVASIVETLAVGAVALESLNFSSFSSPAGSKTATALIKLLRTFLSSTSISLNKESSIRFSYSAWSHFLHFDDRLFPWKF